MNEKPFENKKSPEKIFTREEIIEALGLFVEGAEFVRELSDEQGIYLYEVKKESGTPGEFAEYTYQRAGDFPRKVSSDETVISVSYYKDDMPYTGTNIGKLVNGKWQEMK